ncbi:MAG: insulinase family protein [Bacillota bacterium]
MQLKKNEKYHGFILVDEQNIEEINSISRVFYHEKSGARLLQLENDDDNKVFSISFRTPPYDSTGLPHILEHSVLCGSRKFPSKEPFVELIKGSLNTFLNAMTFSDKTMYPIASRNDKDFKNLMDVYLDAVLYPNIYKYPEILMQEGWHYELLDKSHNITYKGVVYNEMQGAFSTPESILMRKIEESLYPDTPYANESGGDPDFIPELTYEDFIEFHKKYYHPSNSYIYIYGNGKIDELLEFIDSNYLKDFDKIQVDSLLPLQKAFNEMREIKVNYPIAMDENEKDKAYFSLNFSVGRSTDPETYLAMEILEHLLLATPASPLKKALIMADLGKDVFGQYDNSIIQPVLSIVIKNSNESKKDEFKKVVFDTLRELCEKGIDKRLVEASINSKEFSLREADFRDYPKGLIYNIKCMDSWLHGEDPNMHFRYEAVLEKIKSAMTSDYFEKLIKRFLLDNKHCSLITLLPQKGLSEERQRKIRERLDSFKASLNDSQLEELIDNTQSLKERQSSPDSPGDLAKIPLLDIKDIKRDIEVIPQIIREEAGTTVLMHPLFTNGIAYVNLLFDTTAVKQEQLPYMSLLADILGKVNTKNYSYEELSNEININTGELKFNIQVYGDKLDERIYHPKFSIKSKALISKLPELFRIAAEIVNNSVLEDTKRLKEIIREIKSRREMRILNEGHMTTARRLISYFSEQGKYLDYVNGFTYFKFLEKIEKELDDKAADIKKMLQEVSGLIFNRSNLLAGITCDEAEYRKFASSYVSFVQSLSSGELSRQKYSFELVRLNEGLLTQSNIQYVAQGYNFRKLGYDYTGSLQVLAVIARFDYLWNRIRVQGGAYGAMAGFERNGNMFFASYRDPNLKETLNVYKEMADFLYRFDADEREMTKLIIGTISKLDMPMTPVMKGERGVEYYLRKISAEDLQRERNEILSCNQDKIRQLGSLVRDLMDQSCYCVLGNENKLKQNKDIFNNLITVFE